MLSWDCLATVVCALTTCSMYFLCPFSGGAAEEDINSQLGVGSVAADAELDAMKEQVGWGLQQLLPRSHELLAALVCSAASAHTCFGQPAASFACHECSLRPRFCRPAACWALTPAWCPQVSLHE